uniref:Phosphatidylinositol-specific phospholipase C X domain-containing protein n=1 Tax=Cynoglossus semilaevis TaxID=244447 RepID=A0A3P8VD61_CYNSE
QAVDYSHTIVSTTPCCLPVKTKRLLSKDGFLMYLQDPETAVLNPDHRDVYQDMTKPLNHYFISSSHNTYLMEDQLKGPSKRSNLIRSIFVMIIILTTFSHNYFACLDCLLITIL